MSTERLIARPWANHAATTVGVERAGEFVPLAECSGHGRMSTDDEPTARRLAACWNAFDGVPTDLVEARKQRDDLLAAQRAWDVDEICGLLSAASERIALGEPDEAQRLLRDAILTIRESRAQ